MNKKKIYASKSNKLTKNPRVLSVIKCNHLFDKRDIEDCKITKRNSIKTIYIYQAFLNWMQSSNAVHIKRFSLYRVSVDTKMFKSNPRIKERTISSQCFQQR